MLTGLDAAWLMSRRSRSSRTRLWPAMGALMLQGCSGQQTVLNPASGDAGQVAVLWWAMLAFGAVFFAAVLVLIVAGVGVGRSRPARRSLNQTERWAIVVGGGALLPLVTVVALLLASLGIGGDSDARAARADVTIEVTGKQWWWEVSYLDDAGDIMATTANEIHVPVNKAVRILLKSDNVIHSFWVPNLQGKTDMIPGRVTETWLRVRDPGVYRGQCAEFCGVQHAFMAFLVIAEPAVAFTAWLERQRSPSVLSNRPAWDTARKAFLSSGCAGCHTIRGTDANGTAGPDLTHFGARRTLGAATLPNTRDHLARWVADAQGIKPGNKMPAVPVTEARLDILVDYLENLE